jgi:nitrogen fixation protein FixH
MHSTHLFDYLGIGSPGAEFDGDLFDVDLTMGTSHAGVYATGAMVHEGKWQAIIPAGDGRAERPHEGERRALP